MDEQSKTGSQLQTPLVWGHTGEENDEDGGNGPRASISTSGLASTPSWQPYQVWARTATAAADDFVQRSSGSNSVLPA